MSNAWIYSGWIRITYLYFNDGYIIEVNSILSSFCVYFYKELSSGIEIFFLEKPWFEPW